jgi:pimeloyl-ACP methyl ester carboxylesterase
MTQLVPPRLLYLHGFASSINSTKGVAFERHFAPRAAIERLDLRVPSFEHLRLSAMIDVVRAAIGGERERVVLIGSSLGGLTAARTAERDARVSGLILLAPAFRIAERWQEQLGPAWDEWRRTGWRVVDDHATGAKARIDFGFCEDLEAVDMGWPDVRVPTLIVHGRGDDAVPVERSRTFAAGKPHVQLVEVDDGHELRASLSLLLAKADRFLAPWLGLTAD